MTTGVKGMDIQEMAQHGYVVFAPAMHVGLNVGEVGTVFCPQPLGDACVNLRTGIEHPVARLKQLTVH